MELPFYYSLEEFQKYYNVNFQDWKKIFKDGSETEFANDYLKLYNNFFNVHNTFKYRIDVKMYDENNIIEDFDLYHFEYTTIIEKRLRLFIDMFKTEDKEKYAKEIIAYEPMLICDFENTGEINTMFDDGYIIEIENLMIYSELFTYDFSDYSKKWFLSIDNLDYKNFEYSLKRIREFLNDKINTKNIFPENLELPEPSLEIEEEPEEKDAKVKFILLKELGIIDFLINQNYNNTDIGKILKPIVGIKETYTANILTADFKLPDLSAKSAYKRKNLLAIFSKNIFSQMIF